MLEMLVLATGNFLSIAFTGTQWEKWSGIFDDELRSTNAI